VPSPKSNPRQANGHRRRKVRAQVLREETHCWLCGELVDKTLPAGLPGSPEVDEIVPVSLGGSPFDRSNCRLSHRIHNQQRGNGLRHLPRKRSPDFTTTAKTDQ
jgi:5-methylcytosine-specific restriction endonuclease McrA